MFMGIVVCVGFVVVCFKFICGVFVVGNCGGMVWYELWEFVVWGGVLFISKGCCMLEIKELEVLVVFFYSSSKYCLFGKYWFSDCVLGFFI